ncbi:MAG: DUF4339 domain-containing protein [Synergistaceae bacterium]|jgi:hypothetical protein|nr:DUF4339 domain-containing protein [Synergistaceae bacterium]
MVREWYYSETGQIGDICGPFPEDQVRKMIRNRQLTEDTLVWCKEPDFAKRGWTRIADTALSSQIPMEEAILNDVKRTLMLKILQMIKEANHGILGFVGLMGLLMLVGLIGWMAENIFLVIGLIVLVVMYMTTVIILRHRRLKRQQDIEILNTDVNKMGDDEAARRAKKYQG